jgi:hypothetical protein
MIHIRVVSPPETTTRLMPVLLGDEGVVNLTVIPASVRIRTVTPSSSTFFEAGPTNSSLSYAS